MVLLQFDHLLLLNLMMKIKTSYLESEDKPDEYKPDEDKIPETEDKYIVGISNVKSTDYGVVTIRSSSSPESDDEDKDKLPER